MTYSRRKFMLDAARAGAAFVLVPSALTACASGSKQPTPPAAAVPPAAKEMFFKISLAEWSLNKTLFAGKISNLDFPVIARNEFGIDGVEYVNQFFKDKARDQAYLTELKKRCDDNGVKSVLIMVDGEGGLGDTNTKQRNKAVENHHQWVEAAKFLGCHSIRVNAYGEGTAEAVGAAAVEGLAKLTEYATTLDINVIVENHGGFSSDGNWMSDVIRRVNNPRCGMLPDFGNFCVEREKVAGVDFWASPCAVEYDRYKGVEQFMPYAKAVSAKSNEFDAQGNETKTDYLRMMKIVKDAGYKGYVGIEYEGDKLDEYAGIRATKALLERVGAELS